MKEAFAMSLYHKNSALFVRHVELNVKDLPKMVDFYTRVLQFNILKETKSEVHFSSDGVHTLLSLYQSDAPATNRNTSLYHVAY
ncbi:MAG: glyoxalase, partial [Tenericutes bacterium HGW-Tenericutes-8]